MQSLALGAQRFQLFSVDQSLLGAGRILVVLIILIIGRIGRGFDLNVGDALLGRLFNQFVKFQAAMVALVLVVRVHELLE